MKNAEKEINHIQYYYKHKTTLAQKIKFVQQQKNHECILE